MWNWQLFKLTAIQCSGRQEEHEMLHGKHNVGSNMRDTYYAISMHGAYDAWDAAAMLLALQSCGAPLDYKIFAKTSKIGMVESARQ